MEPAFYFFLLQLTSCFLSQGTSHAPAQAAGCEETRLCFPVSTYFLFFKSRYISCACAGGRFLCTVAPTAWIIAAGDSA